MAAQVSTKPTVGTVLRKFTPTLVVACSVTALLNVLFGMDTTSFSGVQSIPAFDRQFGTPIGPKGAYQLSASRSSFMSSVAFAGKFFGALSGPVVIEKLGHRWCIWILCLLGVIGVVVECTSKLVVQFVWGRIILYFAVGLAEIASTTYQSEIVPAAARGAIVGSIQLFNQFGQITATGVNERFSTGTQAKDWIIPVSIQAIPPVVIFFGTLLIPNTPRWLISKQRKDDAVQVLEKVRPKADIASGHCKAEADAIEDALDSKIDKGPWLDIFRGTNLRRTGIVSVVFIIQQFTGQAFVSQYSPRFYKTVGLGTHAFDYNIASATAGWAGVFICLLFIDKLGRRTILMISAIGQGTFLFLVAGLGLHSATATASQAHGLVAGVILYNFFYAGGWAPISYVIGAELGTAALREKTASFGLALNFFSAWLTSFIVPYLLNDISANIGWLFGSVAFFGAFYTFFFVPETKNRSLEELDELFGRRISARMFSSTETFGAGRRVAELENLSAGEADEAQNHRVERHEIAMNKEEIDRQS